MSRGRRRGRRKAPLNLISISPEMEKAQKLNAAIEENRLFSFAEGQSLRLEDFLAEDVRTWTPLATAVSEGRLDQVIEVLKSSGQQLASGHFLAKDSHGYTVIDVAGEYHHLDQLFAPSLWKCRVGEMLKLWQQVPQEYREQIDFEALRDEAMLQSRPPAQKWDAEKYAAAVPSSSLERLEGINSELEKGR